MGVETVFIIVFVVIGVVLLGSVVFTGWVLLRILTGVGRSLGWLVGLPTSAAARVTRRLPPPPNQLSTLRCPRPGCHSDNAPAARFCRRCGTPMAGDAWLAARTPARPAFARRVATGRAAMW